MAGVDKIPRFEWNHLAKLGTLQTGSDQFELIDSHAGVLVGMFVSGAGVPAGATVLAVTSEYVTLSVNATEDINGSLTFFKRFDSRYPPELDSDEQQVRYITESKSLSGVPQTSLNYIEGVRDMLFNFLLPSEKEVLIKELWGTWGAFGLPIHFFPDKTQPEYLIYKSEDKSTPFNRTIKKFPDFLYSVKMKFTRKVF